MNEVKKPFWESKSLAEMSSEEWEALCDGCGKCCLGKTESPEGEIRQTMVACRLLDPHTCRCSSYQDRHRFVPDCVRITFKKLSALRWLPETCAYRLLADGQRLPSWHPLVSGDAESVHQAGQSARGKMVSERDVDTNNLSAYVVDGPI